MSPDGQLPVPSTKKEEEYSEMKTPKGTQVVRRKTTATPSHTAEELTTETGGEGDHVVRSTQTVAPSAAQSQAFSTKKRLFYGYQVVWYVLTFIEILFAFRFALKILGANPRSGFASFIYNLSFPFAQPFLTLFSPSTTRGAETTAQVEWSTVVAAIVYAILAWGIVKLLKLSKPISQQEIEQEVNRA